MPISIYPPTLQSTQPAFLSTELPYRVYFSLWQGTSINDVQAGHIQLRVMLQSNNKSIVNTAKYPDGTIYKSPAEMHEESNGRYSILIESGDLQGGWEPGVLYKLQMRFGTTPMYSSLGEFATWKQQQIDYQTFSEWSTVMVIKAIQGPEVFIKNAESVSQDVYSAERTEATLTPLFTGTYSSVTANKEALDKYKFDLYQDDILIESSGWLQHNNNKDISNQANGNLSIDTHRFKYVLTDGETYRVVYSIITVNGYEASATPYTFQAVRSYYGDLIGTTLRVDDSDVYCRENGCLRIYLTSTENLSGAYVLTRASEKTNYVVWEDIKYFVFTRESFNDDLIFDDFTVESGIRYQYAFQQENAAGLRTTPLFEAGRNKRYTDFEYSYFYHNDVQLKLKFNQKLSSFKHTALGSKQDTLGDRYPHILKNGYAYYAEFPISGTISFKIDEDQTFFKLGTEGFMYQDQLVIPRDKLPVVQSKRTIDGANPIPGEPLTIDTNLTYDNIFVERMFREKAEEFLNNYDYKLYKSPTEGNIVVVLMNVSLTPNATVGRMIFDFSATAYEVLENTIENLNEYGIIDIGGFATLESDEVTLSMGQLPGIYGVNNLYDQIRTIEEVSIGAGYKYKLKRLHSFWIDRYPPDKLTAKLTELQAQREKLIEANEPTDEIDAEIEVWKALEDTLQGPQTPAILNIGGKNIAILPNRIYSLREPIQSLSVVSCSYPIIVNYVCELTQVEDLSVGVVSAVDASRIWGQLYGVFTDADGILKTYNYDYGPGRPPLRVYNGNPDKTVVYDKFGNVLIDNTNFNVYKTPNIYNIIEEETRKQVELTYNIVDGFYLDEDGQWTDGTIYYEFSDIVTFDIEADPDTCLLIGRAPDGSDAKEIKVGPTGRYILNPMEQLVRYIALKESQFCIVNYKCLTAQKRVERRG